MEPQGRTIASPFHTRRRSNTFHPSKTTLRIRVHVQAVGLNAKTKNRSALSRRGNFSLDIPFYRTWAVTGLPGLRLNCLTVAWLRVRFFFSSGLVRGFAQDVEFLLFSLSRLYVGMVFTIRN